MLEAEAGGPLPKFPWLTDEKMPAFERNNLRLMYGRWLAQERLYDYALEQLPAWSRPTWPIRLRCCSISRWPIIGC